MKSNEIRQKFLNFFEKRGHTIIPSASLVPENDPSVLFNTAGMQPLVPYLLGEKHPAGTRIVDVQKCVRTTDIDEVGDNTHLTFFEMLGNWSLGDYFKKEAITWSYEFLTDEEEGLGLDINRLYVTVFEGNEDAPRDDEAYEIWKDIFTRAGLNPEGHIFFMDAKSNWWSPGDNGPCGPDSEMFYSTVGELGDMTKEEFIKADDEQKVVEVWNDVFMEYEKKDGKVIGKLSQKNVDTGAGLERLAVMMQGKDNVFETDLFSPIVEKIVESRKLKVESETNFAEQNSSSLRGVYDEAIQKSTRIIADHIRTAVFMISDGVIPSNTDRGYILRRIIRRAVRHIDILGIKEGGMVELTDVVINQYGEFHEEVKSNSEKIKEEIQKEESKFRGTLEKGLKEFKKLIKKNISKINGVPIEEIKNINGLEISKVKTFNGTPLRILSGKDAFYLFETFGFPMEIMKELCSEEGAVLDEKEFQEEMKKHQELSRTASVGKFKGGLGGDDENSTKLHTTTHLLLASLREILGQDIYQKGSNITPERLRFDFNYPEKLTDEQKQKIEDLVNEKIQQALPVEMIEMPKEEALKISKVSFEEQKYGDVVKVYKIDDFSIELCGGPHVKNTSELGTFKIKKEEASSAGVRRIKAVLE